MSETDNPKLEEIRDFLDDEAAVLTRLENLLAEIGRNVRERSLVGLDRAAMWDQVEQRLGWSASGHSPEAGATGK
ncbi:MAG: hypothetical protein EXQ69_03305 [Acidimicrobiia bacterium]|nr:hypothetical protein [Acidimicrobiia bacterium]